MSDFAARGCSIRRMGLLRRAAGIAWAAPWTVVGLALGAASLLFGASVRWRDGALEFAGGRLGRWVARLPAPLSFSAITFGHVILGVDVLALALARAHEHVHVRQYERWGPLFVPAYLLSSLVQWLRHRDPYLDNRFEREAFERTSAPRR